MISRALHLGAAFAIVYVSGAAYAAPAEPIASFKSETPVSSPPSGVSTYRLYAKNQADNLAIMTRALTTGIKHGDLDAAQSTYAPAHRFYKRIEPIARLLRDPARSMDARADTFEKKDADPDFVGFHRIEYGLFAQQATTDLSPYADRLQNDARELFERVTRIEIAPNALLDESARLVKEIADEKLSGEEERYSRTDLWDLEANIDGVREIVTMARPRIQNRNDQIFSRMDVQFTIIGALLEKNKQGCGFKDYDKVAEADKLALKSSVAALAAELSALHGTLAMN